LRYRLEYLVLRFLIGIVRLFPIDLAANVSAKAWRLIAPYNRRHKRALLNLERAFPTRREKSAAHRQGRVGESRPRHGRDHEHRSHSR
jgi:KDO2-lipid IV(A) lauroyltransferase